MSGKNPLTGFPPQPTTGGGTPSGTEWSVQGEVMGDQWDSKAGGRVGSSLASECGGKDQNRFAVKRAEANSPTKTGSWEEEEMVESIEKCVGRVLSSNERCPLSRVPEVGGRCSKLGEGPRSKSPGLGTMAEIRDVEEETSLISYHLGKNICTLQLAKRTPQVSLRGG